jgi:ABC-type transport system substrate-binding protein/class 3 adenylate cyclase
VTDGTDAPAEIRTFLIADVRGYTRFTQTRGDEAAARLAARFAEVVREVVEEHGGRVVELRGDEALCVFGSPRSALRAAVDVQRRCGEEIRADPSLPLDIGIGIDAGEAIPVAGGYRGGALNLAARLCSIAKRGEVLVSDGVVHLARRTDEITYIDRGQMAFKGFDEPVHVLQLDFDPDLPAEEPDARPRWTPVRLASLAVAGVAVLAGLVALAATTIGSHHPSRLGTNVVGMLDTSGHILGDVRLGGSPGGLAAGAGAVWATVTDRNEVVRIDPTAHVIVDHVPVNGRSPTGVAVGGGVWVADGGSGEVSWINPKDTGVVRNVPVGQGPGPIAYGEGAAWVVNTTDATLQRIDGTTFRASDPVAVGGSPSAVVSGGSWVWVVDSGSGTVVKIDPRTLQVVGRFHVGNNPVAAAYGGGRLWVANADDGTVTRLDPATQQGQPIPVGVRPSGIAYIDGTVWVATAAGVTRIDGALHTHSTPTGSTPLASVAAGGKVWVAALASPASHRGGTLRVAYGNDDFGPGFGPYDPAVAPYQDHFQLLSMTSDGLVTYRRAGGAAGLQVVPDLAVAMPTVTDGGRTYTFQLRNRLRYSNGQEVRPSDFRSSVERTLSPAALGIASQGYYQDVVFSTIVGYGACRSHPQTCDLTKGIQTDDRTGTITIHLSKPDPALPQKLATTFADLVPPGAPPADSNQPVPGTGPYMVSKLYQGGHGGVLLTRNPHFQEWSSDAQPAGYPDTIRYTRYKDPGAALTAVEQGKADVMVGQPPPERFSELASRYATLAHPVAGLSTVYISLNTAVPPFTGLAARQALNFAVDRAAMARTMGGASATEPTCQVLPPGMFGYAPYCPYTRGRPAGGTWAGADLPRARKLVAESGTEGDRVVLWAWGGSDTTPLVPSIVRVLNQLGYRASSHVTSANGAGYGEWNATTSDSRRRVSAVLTGWAADYPNPIDFFDVLLSCRAFMPHDPRNLNTSELCDPTLDDLIHRAEARQVSNPAGGAALWQAADRRAVDLAPWVPLLTNVQTDVVSDHTGNYQHNPQWSVLLDQLWVR